MIVLHKGLDHEVLVRAPSRPAPSCRPPIVLLLHGSGSSGAAEMAYSGIGSVADSLGFVVVAPDGSKRSAAGFSWAAADDEASFRDEVAFLDDVSRAAVETYDGDSERVYLLGYSGGARMASRYAAARRRSVAGLCAVAGLRADISAAATSHSNPGNQLRHFVPVLAFHGEQDPVNPYGGGGPPYWGYSVPDAARAWAEGSGCTGPIETLVSDGVRMTTYNHQAAAGVVLYSILGGGHAWPGTPHDNGHRPASTEISATDVFTAFFSLGP